MIEERIKEFFKREVAFSQNTFPENSIVVVFKGHIQFVINPKDKEVTVIDLDELEVSRWGDRATEMARKEFVE